jgi:hypothetical protein
MRPGAALFRILGKNVAEFQALALLSSSHNEVRGLQTLPNMSNKDHIKNPAASLNKPRAGLLFGKLRANLRTSIRRPATAEMLYSG